MYTRFSLARSPWEWLLASESQIYRFCDKTVVSCYPLCHNVEMRKLLGKLVASLKVINSSHLITEVSATLLDIYYIDICYSHKYTC